MWGARSSFSSSFTSKIFIHTSCPSFFWFLFEYSLPPACAIFLAVFSSGLGLPCSGCLFCWAVATLALAGQLFRALTFSPSNRPKPPKPLPPKPRPKGLQPAKPAKGQDTPAQGGEQGTLCSTQEQPEKAEEEEEKKEETENVKKETKVEPDKAESAPHRNKKKRWSDDDDDEKEGKEEQQPAKAETKENQPEEAKPADADMEDEEEEKPDKAEEQKDDEA